jgi:photosystem II stability/assembly factor-like uncharacterized protein
LYIATPKRGAYFSPDAGLTWVDWTDVLKDNDLGSEVRDIVVTPGEESKIFLATTYGLLRSSDGAETWEKIKLIPPEKNATINAIAVNPSNDQEIYYVTYTTFYRSIDGGENWAPAKLPTTRAGWKIMVDPIDQKTLYMSVRSFEK